MELRVCPPYFENSIKKRLSFMFCPSLPWVLFHTFALQRSFLGSYSPLSKHSTANCGSKYFSTLQVSNRF